MNTKVKEWLESGKIDLFLGYKMEHGHPLPHAFNRERIEELDELISGPARYPLEKFAAELTAADPDVRIGLLARDCTQRALNVLTVWHQADPDRMVPLNVNCCPSTLKDHAECSYLDPPDCGLFKKQIGVDKGATLEDLEKPDPEERLSRWMYEFQKCIKCYGCRDICPVCFCEECALEHDDLIGTGHLPPEAPIFHLIRAVHMAGRCVDCGLCEEACPAEIPPRLLYRKVNAIVDDLFDYRAGSDDLSPFSIIGENVLLETLPVDADR